jgi:NADPH:quinone reductase-like Zn-dependent oxidoreductase
MKAVRIHQFGGPEVLSYEDIPDPLLRKDQVTGSRASLLAESSGCVGAQGLPGVKLPHILGSDIAGEVAKSVSTSAGSNRSASASRSDAFLRTLREMC